ncbi:hypothetical protein QMK38_11585 [Lysinibacillus fusiformis]|nr:hypothetical protein [Lysinibacillus fusiformis]
MSRGRCKLRENFRAGRALFAFLCLAAGASTSTISESPARTKSVLLSIPPIVFEAGRAPFAFLCPAAGASSSTISESPARTKSVLLSIPPIVFEASQAPLAFLLVTGSYLQLLL